MRRRGRWIEVGLATSTLVLALGGGVWAVGATTVPPTGEIAGTWSLHTVSPPGGRRAVVYAFSGTVSGRAFRVSATGPAGRTGNWKGQVMYAHNTYRLGGDDGEGRGPLTIHGRDISGTAKLALARANAEHWQFHGTFDHTPIIGQLTLSSTDGPRRGTIEGAYHVTG